MRFGVWRGDVAPCYHNTITGIFSINVVPCLRSNQAVFLKQDAPLGYNN